MSEEIDRRIVEMQFDNYQFEKGIHESMNSLDEFEKSLDLGNSARGFEKLGDAADNLAGGAMNNIAGAASKVGREFSAMQTVAFTALQNITNKAVDAGEKFIKSITVDQISAGYSKYEEKVKSVQTIMASTGKDVDSVSRSLERLNWYTDETSASYSDMINNIGKFTSNNIDLDTAISATEGIANWAMVSGQNNSTASRAYYNLAQALSVGSVQLMDWKSIQNANMATTEFKQTVLDTATDMGMLVEVAEGVYETTSLTMKAGEEVTNENFTNALTSSKWFTSDVLLKVLNKYGDFADRLNEASSYTDLSASELIQALDQFKQIGEGTITLEEWAAEWGESTDIEILTEYMNEFAYATDEAGRSLYDLGVKSFKAAQEAKTFSDAVGSIKDAVSTQFMNLFETLFGNYEEAKSLWTDVANWGYDVFVEPLNSLNEFADLVFGKTMDRFDDLSATLENLGVPFDVFSQSFAKVMGDLGVLDDVEIGEDGVLSFERIEELLQKGVLDADALNAIIEDIQNRTGTTVKSVKGVKKTFEEVRDVVYDIIRGDYDNQPIRSGLLESEGYEYEKYQALVNKIWNYGKWDGVITQEDVDAIFGMDDETLETIFNLSEEQIASLRKLAEEAKNGDKNLEELLQAMNGMSGGDMLSASLHNLMEMLSNIVDIAKEVWAALFPKSKVSTAKSALNGIMGFTEFLKDITSDTEGIALVISTVLKPIVNTGKLITKLFGKGFEIVKDVLSIFGEMLPESNLSIFENISEGADGLYEILSSLIDLIDPKAIAENVREIVDFFKEMFSSVKDFFSEGFSGVKDLFADGDMFSIGEWTVQGFVDGIKNGAKTIWNIAKNIFQGFIDSVNKIFGIASPSKVMFAIAGFVILGFIKGINKNLPKLGESLGSIFDAIGSFFDELKNKYIDAAFEGEGTQFEQFVGKIIIVVELLKTKASDSLKDVSNVFEHFGKSVSDAFKKVSSYARESNYIFDWIGKSTDKINELYKGNNGNFWDTLFDFFSFKRQEKNNFFDSLIEKFHSEVETESFSKWLKEGMADGSFFANSAGQFIAIVDIIFDRSKNIFEKIKAISDTFETYHPVLDYITEQINSLLQYIKDNLSTIVQIGKLAVTFKKLKSITNMYDAIAGFFNGANGVTSSLKTVIESYKNPLQKTATTVKKLSKSQAFFEVTKGILAIGASIWLIINAFKQVYDIVVDADASALVKTETIIFSILGILVVLVGIIGVCTELISHSNTASLSGNIALNSISNAIKWLAIIIAELVALSYIATKLSAGTIVALGLAMTLLTVFGYLILRGVGTLVATISEVKPEQIEKASGIIGSIAGLITIVMGISAIMGVIAVISPKLYIAIIGSVIFVLGTIALLMVSIYTFIKKINSFEIPDVSALKAMTITPMLGIIGIIAAMSLLVGTFLLLAGNNVFKWLGAAAVIAGMVLVIHILLKEIDSFVRTLNQSLKGKFNEKSEALMKTYIPLFAFVISLILALTIAVSAIILVCGDNVGKYIAAGAILLVMTGAVIGVLAMMSYMIGKVTDHIKKVPANNFKVFENSMKSMALVIGAVAGLMIAIAASTAILALTADKVGPENIVASVLGLGAVLFTIAWASYGLMSGLKKIGGRDSKDVESLSESLVKVLFAISILVSAVSLSLYALSDADPNGFKMAAITVGIILTVITGLVIALSFFLERGRKESDKTKKKSTKDVSDRILKTMLAVSALIATISMALYFMSKIDKNALVRSTVAMIALSGGILLFLWALKKLITDNSVITDSDTGKGTKFNKVIKTVVPLVLSIVALCIAAILLGGIEERALKRGVFAIAAIGAVVSAILFFVSQITKNKSTKEATKWKNISKIGIIVSITAAIGVLAYALYKLATIEGMQTNKLFAIVGAIASLGAIVLAAIALMKLIDKLPGKIGAKLIVSFITVAASLSLLFKEVGKLAARGYEKGKLSKVVLGVGGLALIVVALIAVFTGLALISKQYGTVISSFVSLVGVAFFGISIGLAALVASIGYFINSIEKFSEFLLNNPGLFDKFSDKTSDSANEFSSKVTLSTSKITGALLQLAYDVVDGIRLGLESNKDLVQKIVDGMASCINILSEVLKTDSGFSDAVANLTESLTGILSGVVKGVFNGVRAYIRENMPELSRILDFVLFIPEAISDIAKYGKKGLLYTYAKFKARREQDTEAIPIPDGVYHTVEDTAKNTENAANDASDALDDATKAAENTDEKSGVFWGVVEGLFSGQGLDLGSVITKITGQNIDLSNLSNNDIFDLAQQYFPDTDFSEISGLLDTAGIDIASYIPESVLAPANNTAETEELKDNVADTAQETTEAVVAGVNEGVAAGLASGADSTVNNTAEEVVSYAYESLREAINTRAGQISADTSLTEAMQSIFSSDAFDPKKQEYGVTSVKTILDVINDIESIDTSALEEALNSIGAAGDSFRTAEEFTDTGYDGAAGLILGFINGLNSSQKEELATYLDDIFGEDPNGVIGIIRGILDWHSPSGVTKTAAIDFIDGFIEGLDDPEKIAALDSSVAEFSNHIVSTFTEALTAADAIEYSPTITPVLDFSAYNGQLDSVNAALFAPQLSINGKAIGEIANMSGTITIVNDNRDIVTAVNNLQNKMDGVVRAIDGMKVVMDTGALVGQLSGPMDKAIGNRQGKNARQTV